MIDIKSSGGTIPVMRADRFLKIRDTLRKIEKSDKDFSPEESGWIKYADSPEDNVDSFLVDVSTDEVEFLWEDVCYHKKEEMFEIVIMMNNDFGYIFFIPRENLSGKVKDKLLAALDFKNCCK